MADLIGQRLGQYEIKALLGEGGMASVYQAFHPMLRRDVAIKVIESRLARKAAFVTRFEREAQIVASLNHPNILKIFDYGRHDDLIYLVMELEVGGSLTDLIRAGDLTLELASRLFEQVASALDYAHSRGIIHRDLKPQNVLLDGEQNAILSDFGIAKLIGEDVTQLTQSGMAMGTPAYMSPEQWQGRPLDSRSDLYALGVMLFEMLTGRLPFVADTPFGMMHMHVYEPPPSLRTLRPDLSADVEAVLDRALAKNPDERYQSARELAQEARLALARQLPTAPATAPRQSSPETDNVVRLSEKQPTNLELPPARPRKRAVRLGSTVLVALVLLGILGVLLSRQNTADQAAQTATLSPQPIALQPTITGTPVAGTHTASPQASSTAKPSNTPVTTTGAPTALPTLTHRPSTNSPAPTRTSPPSATTLPRPTNTVIPPTSTPISTPTRTPDSQKTLAVIEATRTAIAAASLTKTSTQTATTTATSTATVTASATATPKWTLVPTATPTVTSTATSAASATATATATATQTPTSALTPTPVPIATRTDPKGVAQIYVPAGCFQMGSDPAKDQDAQPDEQPQHEVCITTGYWIDTYEVTNTSYQQFINAGGNSQQQYWSPDGWQWFQKNKGPQNYNGYTNSKQPRVGISWYEADAYARWRGCRLPTEAEWEYAARGPQSPIYPWGDVYDSAKLNAGSKVGKTANVGGYPSGKSWIGTFDMAGNVWEWVNDWYSDSYYQQKVKDNPTGPTSGSEHVLRGGSWNLHQGYMRSASRFWLSPYFRYSYAGTRVVCNAAPGQS